MQKLKGYKYMMSRNENNSFYVHPDPVDSVSSDRYAGCNMDLIYY